MLNKVKYENVTANQLYQHMSNCIQQALTEVIGQQERIRILRHHLRMKLNKHTGFGIHIALQPYGLSYYLQSVSI